MVLLNGGVVKLFLNIYVYIISSAFNLSHKSISLQLSSDKVDSELVQVLSISNYGVLSPNWGIYKNVLYSKAQRTLQKGEERTYEPEDGEECCGKLSTGQDHCTHELNTAGVTCTRPS